MQNSENTSKGDVLSKRAGQPAGCLQKGTNSIDKESPVWIKFADIHLCAAAGPEKQSFRWFSGRPVYDGTRDRDE